MKKIFIFIAIVIGIFAVVQCSKPTITKEQQDNIAIQIYRNYDIQEIEFLSFTKNESTGSYRLGVKINNDESKITTILIADIKILDEKTGSIGLNPVNRFEDIERLNSLTDKDFPLDLKIKYIGDN